MGYAPLYPTYALTSTDADVILELLPARIREALINRAAEIEYPVEAVIEMAIASFLDTEARYATPTIQLATW